ncbi:lytic polysaccharide monooxygenase [Microbulbifer thermotolerans]|uniref:Lytic polysaccharide monooxygenase n=1 Tax=Microbulbifer thermotolerans TaxID=252514 RepID=A0AB35HYX5_MICTH|nr:lytic polysaccharide monooxygenase [Microbulbifer thermotolerans]MCX2783047.1 lytic polysaccharide monooxygenase [Microbulbifer thermotolerans]MCX2802723.1 lytic polysaccharide monooxygenase [Microbulbifer thermotolerans]MCX2835470.1 lytic polysaccharide monooxygenase [Microbulbifer thermotolerans]WKT60006.1 lytic polysaccharide monooxygenase [Microbulbifer thermotolerans]SFC52191.1 chitin-binding protein [Microbulbifer thermotolerans]
MRYQKSLLSAWALALSAGAFGHGLMSEPASRNWFCGAITKPDTAEPGSACAQAFADDFNGGYQFMSVLTHDVGRKGVTPLPANVCGFDSETWNGGATPWDKSVDWPTNRITPGPLTITWDISWGPHFDDTEEFVYYITKPDFQYEVGKPLTWDDFESEPFCNLTGYNDSNPGATPNITPDKGNSLFHTQCVVPERSGRHVIYGEWGRNQWTYERFHGCIDVVFDGDGGPAPVVAEITATPDNSTFVGSGEIQLSAAASQGENLTYTWSLEANDTALYSLSSTSAVETVLSLDEPETEGEVTVRLQVSDGSTSSTDAFTFTHVPASGSAWADLGALTAAAQTLNPGDQVRLRLVTEEGSDVYLPSSPFTVVNGAASVWTYEFAQAVNGENTDVRVGVLNGGNIAPVQSATENRVYAQAPAAYSSAFLQVEAGSGSGGVSCDYINQDVWNSGFVASIVLTNNGSEPVEGWSVSWDYAGDAQVTNGWNAQISGSGPYTATNVDWNATIQPGESVEFGFQGTGSAETPEVSGAICD